METTREHVLRLLRSRREATVGQLAEALDLSQAAVRRHLDGLRADAYVDARFMRHGVGRPSLVYFPTELGEESASHGYLPLLSRLIRRLGTLEEVDIGGSSGLQVLERAFDGVAHQVAADHQVEVRGVTLEERVAQTSRALAGEGIIDTWVKDGEDYRLINGDCPYLRLAETSDAPCRLDRQSIELLLGTHVEQLRRIADREPVCEYIVRPEHLAVEDGEGAKVTGEAG